MDIYIEAPDHPHFDQLEKHYRSTLSKRYNTFEFIKTIEAKVEKENNNFSVKLIVDLEKVPRTVVQTSDLSEDKAFRENLQKLDHVVRKYKTKHYHGI